MSFYRRLLVCLLLLLCSMGCEDLSYLPKIVEATNQYCERLRSHSYDEIYDQAASSFRQLHSRGEWLAYCDQNARLLGKPGNIEVVSAKPAYGMFRFLLGTPGAIFTTTRVHFANGLKTEAIDWVVRDDGRPVLADLGF